MKWHDRAFVGYGRASVTPAEPSDKRSVIALGNSLATVRLVLPEHALTDQHCAISRAKMRRLSVVFSQADRKGHDAAGHVEMTGVLHDRSKNHL
jgi:hypothetical protein